MRVFALLSLLTAMFASTALAGGPWKVNFQDQKNPSQFFVEHDQWANPLASSATRLKSGTSIGTSTATSISTFTAQPDFARNIILTPGGTTANVGAGTAVVSGLNIFGKAISENFTIGATQSTAVTGNKAFKSVSSVTFPAATGSGVTLSIGIGTKLGLRRCLDKLGDYAWSVYGGEYESTRGTVASSAINIESNTFIPNGTEDGAHNVDIYYLQNFRCYPGM